MAKRLALGYLAVASVAILTLFMAGPHPVSWLLAPVVMGLPVSLVSLAVSREGRLGRLRTPLAILFVLLQLGAAGILVFDGSGVNGVFGLPLSLHFLLLFIWLGPLLVTTLSYAWLFSELGIDESLLRRIAEIRVARESGTEPR